MNGDMAGDGQIGRPFLSILRMPPAIFQHCSVDVLRLAAFHGQQDFLHLGSCPEIEIAAHGLLAAGTSPRAAPSFFLFFHKIRIFAKTGGEANLPRLSVIRDLNSDFANSENNLEAYHFQNSVFGCGPLPSGPLFFRRHP